MKNRKDVRIKYKMDKKELGIYIHIPFCKQKCFYCDFVSYINKCDEEIKKYFNCVELEIDSYDLSQYEVTTIYIGGGTPSFINSEYIKSILEKLEKKYELNLKNIEITIEVNPGTVTEEKINEYKNIGINRISIGLQSTNDKLLKDIGRIHTYNDFLKTYQIIRNAGFKNINVDLMIGVPNQSIKDIKESLSKIIDIQPEHISVYSLIVEDGTKIAELLNKGEISLPSEETERQMYWYVKNTLELNKYKQYEISNFSKENKESKHNINCWEQKEYIGLGCSAHSYIDNVRYSNDSDINVYMNNIENNKKRIIEEIQSEDDKMKEYMMLGFRKLDGISISKFKKKFGKNPIYKYKKEIYKLSEEGLVCVDSDNIRLTNKGLDFANIVFEEFI